jgi:hypothetical protein
MFRGFLNPSQLFNDKFPHILELNGLLFSKVLFCRSKADPEVEGWQDIVRRWELQDLEGIKYTTGDDGIDSFWRTLIVNAEDGRPLNVQYPEKIQFYRNIFLLWRKLTPQHDLWYPQKDELESHTLGNGDSVKWKSIFPPEFPFEECRKFITQLKQGVKGRTFSVLENGYFSMTPEDVIRGDIIAVVRGSDLPIVLRCMDEESKRNLSGLEGKIAWRMIGETWEDFEDGKYKEQTIHLV